MLRNVAFAVLLALIACPGCKEPAADVVRCPQGEKLLHPGCGLNPLPKGCYALKPCASDADCPAAHCGVVTTDPCRETPSVCAACGSEASVCIDAALAEHIRRLAPANAELRLPAVQQP